MFRSIVAEFVQDNWAHPCQRLLASLQTLIQETLDLALTDHLESTRYPLLRTLIESKTLPLTLDGRTNGIGVELLWKGRNASWIGPRSCVGKRVGGCPRRSKKNWDA
jgi:hypothetical protein